MKPRPLVFALGYFGAIFAAGFLFGVARTVLVVPAVGEVLAELLEAPLMLCVIVWAAWILARRHPGPRSEVGSIGALAVLMVLAADLAVGFFLRGLGPRAVLLGRDMVTGSVYYGLLLVLGALPYILWRGRGRDESSGPGARLG